MAKISKIDDVIARKEALVSNLIEHLDWKYGYENVLRVGFTLVENFRDDRILIALVRLIRTSPYDMLPAVVVHWCSLTDSFELGNYLDLWVELAIESDYHVLFNILHIINGLRDYVDIEEEELQLLQSRLEAYLPTSGDKKDLIQFLIAFIQENISYVQSLE